MGNVAIQKKLKYFYLTSGAVSTIFLLKMAYNTKIKQNKKNKENEINERQTLKDFLMGKRVTATDIIKFPKDARYEQNIQKIQNLLRQNKESEDIEKLKELIKLISSVSGKLQGICRMHVHFEHMNRRRREIQFFKRYAKETIKQIRQNEIFLFLAQKEVLRDAGFKRNEYDQHFLRLFEVEPSFIVQLGVKQEYENLFLFANKTRILSANDLKKYFKEKLQILEKIKNNSLIDNLEEKLPANLRGILAHHYINDQLAINQMIEEHEVLLDVNYRNYTGVKSLMKRFEGMFSQMFPS